MDMAGHLWCWLRCAIASRTCLAISSAMTTVTRKRAGACTASVSLQRRGSGASTSNSSRRESSYSCRLECLTFPVLAIPACTEVRMGRW